MTSKLKIANVDRLANITYSLIVGSIVDATSGASALEVVVSRLSSLGVNAATGGFYGWWREQACCLTGTTKESGRFRKGIADVVAFCSMQVPLYAVVRSAGRLIGNGEVDTKSIAYGMGTLAAFSPLIGPTLGAYTDFVRHIFGIKPAAEGAYADVAKED